MRLDERGLPGPAVADDGDVADLPRLRWSHERRVYRLPGAGFRVPASKEPCVNRKATIALLATVAGLLMPGTAWADLADEQALADRYAPVVRLVVQEEECGPGEPYEPIDVDLLFGDPTVALRGPWNATDLVKIGPTASDLAGRYDYHLDFPGSALDPGCDYELWSRRLTEGSSPDRLRPRRDRSGPSREARASVLVLLRLQRLQQPARGRLGDDPARLRRAGRRAPRSRRSPSQSATARTRAPSEPTGVTTSSRSSTGRTRSCIRRPARTRTSSACALPRQLRGGGRRLRRHQGPHREVRPVVKTIPSDPAAAERLSRGSPTRDGGASCRRRSSTAPRDRT